MRFNDFGAPPSICCAWFVAMFSAENIAEWRGLQTGWVWAAFKEDAGARPGSAICSPAPTMASLPGLRAETELPHIEGAVIGPPMPKLAQRRHPAYWTARKALNAILYMSPQWRRVTTDRERSATASHRLPLSLALARRGVIQLNPPSPRHDQPRTHRPGHLAHDVRQPEEQDDRGQRPSPPTAWARARPLLHPACV